MWASGSARQRATALLLGLLVSLAPGVAAPAPTGQASGGEPGPKIVLVLSGGGARGAAHIGVLKSLERHRIPIHAVVGTSMGAVVGGLYASGLSPAKLESVIGDLSWAAVLDDDPARGAFRFRRKREETDFLVDQAIGIGAEGFKLPRGAIQGHNLLAFLNRHTLHVSGVRSFDDLPIPFRAVATDIVTGNARVLESGSLARAMFASMAIPAVIEPVTMKGDLLVDGGVANNLPVDVALAMDADVIIAVDVGSPLSDADDMNSVLDITDQLTTLLTRRNSEHSKTLLRKQDVLIIPALDEIGSLDFDRAMIAIERGEAAAEQAAPALAHLSRPMSSYLAWRRDVRRDEVDSIRVERIEVETDSQVDPNVLARRLGLSPGVIGVDEIKAAVDRTYGSERFSSVSYDFDGSTLTIHPRSRSTGPAYLQFGLDLEDNFEGRNSYNLGVAFTVTELNRKGGEWRSELVIGERPLLLTELYQPIGRTGLWFVAPSARIQGFNFPLFDGEVQIAEYRMRRAGVGLAIGRVFGTHSELRFGVRQASGRAKLLVGDPGLDDADADIGHFYAGYTFDSLDDPDFPRHGAAVTLGWKRSLRGLGADRNYQTFALNAIEATSFGRHTLFTGIDLATVTEGSLPLTEQFFLGGFFNLSGLQKMQLIGQHRGLARVGYYYQWLTNPLLPAYVGASLEAGNVAAERSDVLDDLRTAGSVFVGFDTPLGPVYLAGGLAEGGQRSFYVFLGVPL